MKKKELIVYVVGGGIFFFIVRIFVGLFIMILKPNIPDSIIKSMINIYDLLFIGINISISSNVNPYVGFLILFIYCVLLGGLLSLLFCYNYYMRKNLKNKEIVNPISKKSLFIAIAVFVGFVLLVRVIAWLGGF